MRKLLIMLMLASLCTSSCKKTVENIQRNYVIDVMTDGQWYIDTYKVGDADLSTLFGGYLFQFYEDGRLTGQKGAETDEGTWEGEISTYSIITNFPSATSPIDELNGTWVIKDSGNDYVVAEMANPGGQPKSLKLRKKA